MNNLLITCNNIRNNLLRMEQKYVIKDYINCRIVIIIHKVNKYALRIR